MPHPFLSRTTGATLFAAFSFAAVALGAESARADTRIAIPCDEDPLHCEKSPLSYSKVDALPVQFDFDTGWVPQNSPLQVHIWAGVYAETRVGLNGAYVTSWDAEKPGILGLDAPGKTLGGLLSYHYGAQLGAQGAVHVKILGQQFDWVGDLPYVPQFDFQLDAKGKFDTWAYSPGYALSSETKQQKLAKISIADIIGASIPGIDGGFELDVAMQMTATYTTKEIVLTQADKPVSGGPLVSQNDLSSMEYVGGPFVEVDVHPEGTIDYDGTLHLIPGFYITLLGKSWSIPVADIPISFPITQTEWSFDPIRVHTPLPDLMLPVTEINFGKIEIGQKNLEAFDLVNNGEAKLAVAMTGDNPEFEIWDPAIDINPGDTVKSAFRFVPKHTGDFTATVLVTSNDPDHPLQKVFLKGTGIDGPPLIVETDDPPDPTDLQDPGEPGACACRAAGDTGHGTGALLLFALGLSVAGLRSRRRS